MRPLIERAMSKFVVDKTGCWLWTGAKQADGYGVIREGQRGSINLRAHRVIYEALVGPITDGLTLDHLCRVRHCVNPEHLEQVTIAENVRRGRVSRAQAAA